MSNIKIQMSNEGFEPFITGEGGKPARKSMAAQSAPTIWILIFDIPAVWIND